MSKITEKHITSILLNSDEPKKAIVKYIKARERSYILMVALFALGWVGSVVVREHNNRRSPTEEYVDLILRQNDSLQCMVDSAVYFHEIKFNEELTNN